MRVSVGIHGNDLEKIKETYDLLSCKYFIHATPTLFNAGTPKPQLSSCFLVAMESDSLEGIFDTLKECAQISKWAGGIGLHIHDIRAKDSLIRGTNGNSTGIVPMLKVFNDTSRFINQGGKRNGSFAIYLEPWHADVEDFLEMKKNHGDEEMRARDLFYALWVPDLFMERVKENKVWNLFCPNECPHLSEVHGEAFCSLYEQYEREGRQRKTVQARDLWFKILDAQMETGTPYLLFKDSANAKSNQKNLGTIRSSNLCTEIIEYSDDKETAVCNLASLALPSFTHSHLQPEFDYKKLHEVVKVVVRNLNRVIDLNYYPTEKSRRSNLLHRPIGIGVQGLADVFMILKLSFHSDEAKQINKKIFETIYHASLEASMELSRERYFEIKEQILEWRKNAWFQKEIEKKCQQGGGGADTFWVSPSGKSIVNTAEVKATFTSPIEWCGAYSSFAGSPVSEGILQFDMWGVQPDMFDWTTLKNQIHQYGIRNSLLVAPMPTASTSQILGNNECFEPLTSNIYSRSTLAGEFIVVNKYLMRDLMQLGLWDEKTKNNIISNKGSVQQLTHLPESIRERYKIVWEIPMKHLIDMSADRGAFICQSQSLNLWQDDPTYNSLTSMHFYSWKMGLKTGLYYLRRRAKHQAQQFTVEPEPQSHVKKEEETCEMCSA